MNDRTKQRLYEITVALDKEGVPLFPSDRLTLRLLDEAVVTLLAAIKAAHPEVSPFETFTNVLDLKASPAWDRIGLRMLDTKALVERFKSANRASRATMRSQMKVRGML